MKTSKLLPDPVKILALLLGSCLSILGAGKAHAQTADLFASVNQPDPTGIAGFPGAIFEYTPTGVQSTFVASIVQPRGLAFDSAGNLFVADAGDETIFEFTPAGVRSVFAGPSAFLPNQGPVGLAFDSAGNLFVSTEDTSGNGGGNGQILEFAPNGAETTFATVLTNL